MSVLKNKRILAIIGIVLIFLGTILPYYILTILGYSTSVSLWGYWEGKIITALIVLNTLFIFKDLIQKYIPGLFNSNLGQKIINANPKLSIIPIILIVAFVIYLNLSFNFSNDVLKHGVGFYLLWIGIVFLIVHVFVYKNPNAVQVNTNQQQNYQQSMGQQMQQQNYQQPMGQQMQQQNYQQPMGQQMQQQNYQQPVEPQMQQPTQTNSVNKKFCPTCGNQLDATATQCFMCGSKF